MTKFLAASLAAIAMLAMAGWTLGIPWMNRFGTRDAVPMAPSTALLFLLHAVALCLGAYQPVQPRIRRARTVLSWVTLALAMVLLVLSSLGIRLHVEHLGFATNETLPGIPMGHMSPVTAGCFLLASLADLSFARSTAMRWGWGFLGFVASSLIFGTAIVFFLAYLYGSPLLHGGGLIPPALNTSLALALLGLGFLVPRLSRTQLAADPKHGKNYPWFLFVYLLLAVGMVTAGHSIYNGHERQYLVEIERKLLTIAELKVNEISQFRKERIGDGRFFLGNRVFSGLVARHLAAPSDPAGQNDLVGWLQQVKDAHGYDRVFLLDPSGREIAIPHATETVQSSPQHREAVAECLSSREVMLLDFHRDSPPSGPVRLAVMVPILSVSDAPLAVLVLRIDPSAHFFPMLKRWPIPSTSGETLIVRKEGESVVFLNELRFHQGAVLTLRFPLSAQHMPAVQAALGHRGIVRGTDYRGVRVLASVQAVPDSAWFLVARMDLAEVYAPLTERLWQMVFLVFALLLAVGFGTGLLFRQQTIRFLRERYEAAELLREREQELRQRNEELTRFTYTVSHDLKSPLVTIQTFLGYLEQDRAKNDGAGVEKDIGFIRSAAIKMSGLLDDLLELSRVGRKMNPAADVPLAEILQDAQTLVAGRLSERKVCVELTHEPVVLHGDRTRLVEVFQNLLDNAAKFMGDQPDPRIQIGSERVNGENVLFVRDNGVGIDPRHLPRLFGLFEKLDAHSEGTGIGLALVRRIVEVHGGRIWVESDGPGHGACFKFTLPATQSVLET